LAIKEDYIKINNIRFRYIHRAGKKSTAPLLFLHGFTGSANDWLDVINNLPEYIPAFALDLIGHGKTDAPNPEEEYSTEAQLQHIDFFIKNVIECPPFILGYSMGGRLALQYAVNKPGNIRGLILESTTAGIEDEKERAQRVISDSKLIDRLQTEGVENFINFWMALPLFGSLKNIEPKKYEEITAVKKKNSATGLINSLKGFGTGVMPDVWHKLSALSLPVLILAGEKDLKYVAIGKKLNESIKDSQMAVITGAGHNVHLEKAPDFINFVKHFLNKNDKD